VPVYLQYVAQCRFICSP